MTSPALSPHPGEATADNSFGTPLSFEDDAPTEMPDSSDIPATGAVLSMPRTLRKRPPNWYKRIGIACLVLVLLGGIVVFTIYTIRMGGSIVMGLRLDGGATGPPAVTSAPNNYKFVFPDAPWERDDPTRLDFNANLAFRRANPTAWMTLIALDMKSRTPRTAELLGRGLRYLNDYFEDIDRSDPTEVALGGQPAYRMVFQGVVRKNNARMAGECVMLSHRGVAYWLTCWAPDGSVQAAQRDFEGLRQRFVLLQERRDWIEKRPKPVDYPSEKSDYALRDTEGLWKAQKATDYDELADQAFLAHERDDPGRIIDKEDRTDEPVKDLVRKSATVQVLVLNADQSIESGTTTALKYLEEKQKKEGFPDTVLGKPLTDSKEPLGDVPARRLTLHVKNSDERERFVQMAIVPRPKGLVVILCECDWKAYKKGKWASDFTQFIDSFRIVKSKMDS